MAKSVEAIEIPTNELANEAREYGQEFLDICQRNAKHLQRLKGAGLDEEVGAIFKRFGDIQRQGEQPQAEDYFRELQNLQSLGYFKEEHGLFGTVGDAYKNLSAEQIRQLNPVQIKEIVDSAILARRNASSQTGQPYQDLSAVKDAVQNNPALRTQFEQLVGYYDMAFDAYNGNVTSTDEYNYRHNAPEGANLVNFSKTSKQVSEDKTVDVLQMRVQNLNNTGLSFALSFNQGSLQALAITDLEVGEGGTSVKTMTKEQVRELARFLSKGCVIKSPQDIKLPDNIKIANVADENAAQVFEEAFAEFAGKPDDNNDNKETYEPEKDSELEPQGKFAGVGQEGAGAGAGKHNIPAGKEADYAHEFDEYIKDKPFNASMSNMRNKVEKKAKGMLSNDSRRLQWRRNLDGSMTLVGYSDEFAYLDDNELNKKGAKARKKAFAVKINPGPPPRVGIFCGTQKFDGACARMVVAGITATGCDRMIIPSKAEVGDEKVRELIIAMGQQLVLPALKWNANDEGMEDFEAKDLKKYLKAHDEELKNGGCTTETSLKGKMKLVRELENWMAYREKSGRDLDPDQRTAFSNEILKLKGDIKFTKYHSAVQGTIKEFVSKNSDPSNGGKAWTTADTICAVRAQEDLLRAITDGTLNDGTWLTSDGKPLKFNPLDPLKDNPDLFMDLFKARMDAHKEGVTNEISERYAKVKGTEQDEDGQPIGKEQQLDTIANKILTNSTTQLNNYVNDTLVANYGESAKSDYKFSKGVPLTDDNFKAFKNREAYSGKGNSGGGQHQGGGRGS